MDNNIFINLKTFEIVDELPNYISVDKEIAKTISTLNKKGYLTMASCSGHYYIPTMSMQSNIDLDFLKEAESNPKMIVESIKEDSFDCWVENQTTSIYIMFSKKYNFPKLPKGFKLETHENNETIRCTIEFFLQNIRKSEKEIKNEIKKYNKILEEWANNLPSIK